MKAFLKRWDWPVVLIWLFVLAACAAVWVLAFKWAFSYVGPLP